MKKIFLFIVSALFFVTGFAQDPTVPPNNLTFSGISQQNFNISWTRGNGNSCLVVVRPSSSGITHPTDGTTYSGGGGTYGAGSYLGNNSYVVYKGTGTSLFVNGLTLGTQYTVVIYEFSTASNWPYIFPPYYLTTSYETGSHYTLTTPPTVQVTNLNVGSITPSGANIYWTLGNGAYNLTTVKQSSTTNTAQPTDGTPYTANLSFGSGDILGTSPYSYVVHISAWSSIYITGCAPATDYVANCFTYNGLSGQQNYYKVGYPQKGFTTLATQPTGNCTYSYMTDVTDNAMTLHWVRPTSGAGSNVIVTMRASTSADAPVSGTNYSASSTFGSGSPIGSSYVVYMGSSNTVRVTGLTSNTNYYVRVVEYNGGAGTFNATNNYAGSSLTGSKYTLPVEPTTAASNLIFSGVQTNQVTASWTNGNGPYRAVGVRQSRIQTALAFDGVDDYVNVPYNAALQPTSALTVEAWAYKANWASSVGTQVMAGNYYGGGYILFTSGNYIYADIRRNGSTAYLSYDASYLLPGWHHFALTYDGRYSTVYVDGANKVSDDAGGNYPIDYSYANNFMIGVEPGTGTTPTAGTYFNGYIDEVRVWNIAQSYVFIRSNMNKSMLGNEAGLVASWSLNEGFAASSVASNGSLYAPLFQGTLTNFNSTAAASSFTGTSGWVKSGAVVDLPVDFTYYAPNTNFQSGAPIGNKYYTVQWSSPSSVTVTGLTPGTYYDFVIAEFGYTSTYYNYLTSTYLMGDVQTTAQPVPTVSFSPTYGTVGTQVTITGTNFDPVAANNTVYFGATKAIVLSANTAQLVVLVPYCANYVPVSVEVNSVTGTSRNPFVVIECGGTINAGAFTASTYTTGAVRNGTVAKDIDGDGKSDLLVVDNSSANFSVSLNQSANGALGWAAAVNYATNTSPTHITTGDLDGDNKPDVLVGCNGSGGISTIDIFRNLSSSGSVSFATKIQIPSSASPGALRLADFDKDGKLDLVAGHAGGIVSVYLNTSSKGLISFAPRLDLPALSDAASLDVAEFNADGKIDIVVADRTNNNVVFFQNNSTTGSLAFMTAVPLAAGANVLCVTAGDIDSDGRPDVCAGLSTSFVRVCRNQNVGGAITAANFSTQYNYAALNSATYGIVVNDLDGDNKNDIISGSALSGSISVFQQTSPAFTFPGRTDYAGSGLISYYLSADDFSMDGKTDIVASNGNANYYIYNNTINALLGQPIATSSVSVTAATQTTFTVSLTVAGGGGSTRLVVVKPSSSPQIFPSDGVSYSFDNNYSLAPDLGAGNKIVMNSNASSVVVSGLSSNTSYNVYVYECNGTGCTSNYLTNPYGSNSATTLNYPPTFTITNTSPAAVCQSPGALTNTVTSINSGGESQTLVVTATSSNTALIPNGNISVTYTSPASTATVSATPVNGQSGTSVITVKVDDGATNNNIFQNTYTITVTPSPTVANAGSNITICGSATNLAGNDPSSGGIGTGGWSFIYKSGSSTQAIQTPSAYNSQLNTMAVLDSVRLAWTISNAPCPASVSQVSVKRNNCPMTADFIANQTNFCGTNTTVSFSDLSFSGGNTIIDWTWSFPGGTPSTYTTSIGTNPPPITYSTPGIYSVSLTITSNIPSSSSNGKSGYINLTALPGTATTISGPATVCQGQTGITYSVTPISGATTYSWSVPSGGTIIGAATSNTISVSFSNSAVAGNISVTGHNSCGDGTTYNQAIAMNNLPGATGVISGPTSACQSATGVVFTTGAISGASTYTWTLPPGASITGGLNTNSITVSFSNSATDGTIDVMGQNSCGVGTSSSAYGFSIDSLPVPAGIISGNTTVCPGDTVVYGIASLQYANTYSWTLPSGVSIVGSANTGTVTVAYSIAAASGNISVKGVNTCGSGTASTQSVTVNPLPSAATAILFNSGNTTVCAGSPATISAFVSSIPNATTGYNWILPAGFILNSGANTNNIIMSISPTAASGTISVNGINGCGDGVASSVAVTVSPLPGLANTITGSATVCQTQSGVVYTVPAIANATGYSWSLPQGASIASGLNTNTITVDYSATADTGFVTVTGTNGCGNGLSTDSFAVTVNPLPDPAGAITGASTISICPVQIGVSYSVTPVNHATGYIWVLPTGAVIASGNNTNAVLVNYSDSALTGNVMVTPTNACGSGTPSMLAVTVDTLISQNICAVTVDSTSKMNVIVWEKPVSTTIDSFRIYREIASTFTYIGNTKYSSQSQYVDSTIGVNPNITAYKYKVSTVDVCGNESPLSSFHRTIHLAVTPASPCGYNLTWNDYIGFPITQYRIMRDTGTGVYHPVDSVSFGNNAWTDTKCYLITDTIGYYIEVDHPGSACVVSIKHGPDPMTSNLNLSKSNVNRIADTTVTAVPGVNDSYVVSVYPNPSSGSFMLELNNGMDRAEVKIFNMMGEELRTMEALDRSKKLLINMAGYAKGVYQVRVTSGHTIINKKIIIQ